MPADQAAGLRRRSARQPLSCIHCFSESTGSSVRLAHALYRMGRETLVVDTQGRLFADATTRNLFDWRRQLERGQLHILPRSHGKGWYAPGAQADDPALHGVMLAYDHVIFDAGWRDVSLGLRPDALHAVAIEIGQGDESMRHAYAVLKTLAQQGGVSCVGLLGDPGACERVRVACCRFLGQDFANVLFRAENEDDAFAELAVRMAGEETSLRACK